MTDSWHMKISVLAPSRAAAIAEFDRVYRQMRADNFSQPGMTFLDVRQKTFGVYELEAPTPAPLSADEITKLRALLKEPSGIGSG